MKKKNKYYLASILFSSTVLSASIISSCATSTNNTNQENPSQNLANFDVNKFSRQELPNYEQEVRKNGLLADAEEKANATNNVLMYSINWFAVLHRYGPLSHLIKVLEINPNKEVYIYVQADSSAASLFSKIIDLNEKYPNVHMRYISQWNSWETFLFHHQIIEDDLNNLKNKNIDIYLDDYAILNTLGSYYRLAFDNQSVTEANNLILDNYLFLSKMNSINLIADGTASFKFYDDDSKGNYKANYLKGMWLTSNEFDDAKNSYPLSDEIREKLYSGTYSKADLLNKSNYSGALLLQSYLSSSKPLNTSNTIPSKYFNAGTQTIIDMNSDASQALQTINGTNRFFDPYFSVNANIIGLFKSFKVESQQLFEQSLNIKKQDRDTLMNNKISVVYSGRNFDDDPSILPVEATRIINMYKAAQNSVERETIDSKKLEVQVLYKAHPRLGDDYQTRLINEIDKQQPGINAITWLNFFEKSNPFEYYVFEGFLSSDLSVNRIVKYYAAFSTIIYFMQAADELTNIEKIIVSDADLNYVNYYNGFPSTIFPSDKVINDRDFN